MTVSITVEQAEQLGLKLGALQKELGVSDETWTIALAAALVAISHAHGHTATELVAKVENTVIEYITKAQVKI